MTRRSCFLLLILCFACGGADGAPSTWTTRDSAGIAIVENAVPVWGPGDGWRLTETPLLEIGSTAGSPDYEFGRAHGPVRLSDGRIVVADMMSNYMSFYDSAGRFLQRAGGSGGGPGEFTQLYRLRRIGGDTLVALNPPSITSIFTPDGEFVRRFAIEPVPGRLNLWWRGWLEGGLLLTVSLMREGTTERPVPADPEPGIEYARYDIPERPPEYRDSLLHMLFTTEGVFVDSVGEWPGQNINARLPFAPHAAYAFAGARVHHSPGDAVELRTWRVDDTSGTPALRLERIIRRNERDLAVTDSLRQLHVEGQRDMFRRLAERNPGFDMARVERNLAALEFPDSVPAHDMYMHADAAGNIWLQEFRAADVGPFRWSVFDADGRWLGIVETPYRFTVNEIGEDYVLGIGVDSLDVQYVRLYGIRK